MFHATDPKIRRFLILICAVQYSANERYHSEYVDRSRGPGAWRVIGHA